MGNDDSEELAPFPGPPDLLDQTEAPAEEEEKKNRFKDHSLTEDLLALLDDGKTYAEAEVAYQRSRAAFAADRLKGAIGFGLAAFGVLHLALIALTVGIVLSLIPLVGPWAATAIVTVALVLIGALLLRLVKQRVDAVGDAFSESRDERR